MGMKRQIADWWGLGVVVALGVVGVLEATNRLALTYRWLHNHVSPDGWSALAAWATVVIAAGAAIFAWSQVREARRTREEQAQPNVVLFTELNPSAKQFIEIVVKNYGTTPAYHVKAAFDPPLKATPNLVSKGKLADVPVPEFPILAPGQEWRTGWDHSVSRKQHQKKWALFSGKTENELTNDQKFTIQAQMSYTGETYSYEQVIADMTLPSLHTATVTYEDSHGKKFETKAILDSELYKGTTWVDIKSVHDLVKTVDRQSKDQNKLLEAIHRRLAEFGTEHEGIWIYGNHDDEERQYRRAISNAEAQERSESSGHLEWAISGYKGEDPLKRPSPDAAFQAPIETLNIGDWFIPGDDESFELGQAWRIAFIKRHVFEDFGAVYELFRSDGDSIREREGAQIWCVRRPS